MKRFFALATLALALPSAALACGDKKCDKEGCALPAASAAPLPTDGTHVHLAITGMSCGSCATKVQAALTGVKGVKGATVDHATGIAEVAYDASATNVDALLRAVNDGGHFHATKKD
jgi:copper chaperone CopZ